VLDKQINSNYIPKGGVDGFSKKSEEEKSKEEKSKEEKEMDGANSRYWTEKKLEENV